MAGRKQSDTTEQVEPKKTTRKPRATKTNPEARELPNEKDVKDVLNEVAGGGNARKLMANMIAVASLNQRKDAMSAVADSIVRSFDSYRNSIGHHIATRDVEFQVEFDDDNRSINEVMFSETVTGPMNGNSLNVNVDYFKDLYEQKRDKELIPAKYKKHEYVEYKYNVSNIVEYYTKRFPDILDLFDVFSDMCLNKSDIGVTVEFSDEFIQTFFIDEFQRVLEERQQMDDMFAQQAMGIDGLDQADGEYADFGELDNQLSGNPYDTTDEDLKPILSLFREFGTSDETGQVPVVQPQRPLPAGKTISNPMATSGITPMPAEEEPTDQTEETTGKTISDVRKYAGDNARTINDINLFDSAGRKVNLKELVKSYGGSIFSGIDNVDDSEVQNEPDSTELSPYDQQMQVYDQIYKSVIYQYNILISKVEKKIKKVLDNKLIKKVKYATKIADIYGYSIITINKTDPNDIYIYNPLEVRLYKKKKSNLDMDNFIYGKVETDGTVQRLKVLNHQYNCFILSLDPMVMMPIPNIVRISWYLYLLDLVEILIIYNDLLKSKTIHLLEIPVFDGQSGYDDGQGSGAQNVTDSLALMNMIINNIESKLVMDTDYIKNAEGTTDVAMQLLKNVGLSVAYVPKLAPESKLENIKLDTDDNEYDKLYTMLNEKIFAVLKFPLWFRSSIQIMTTLKAVPREAVQFAHLVFMSRVNSCLSELEAFLEFIVGLHSDEFTVSYQGAESFIPVKLENIKIHIRSILGEYLFENYKSEQTRSTKIQNLLTFVSAGFQVNPKFAVEYVFPEYTIADVLIDAGAALETRRTEIENALNGTTATAQTDENGNLIESDLATEGTDATAAEGGEPAPTTQKVKFNIDWKQVRSSFADALLDIGNRQENQTNELKNIKKSVDSLIRFKSHSFSIKRV